MEYKSKRNFIIAGILFLLFATLTILVKGMDVQAIGPQQSSAGLATLNQFIFERFGVHLIWYHITDWLGVAAILFAFGFTVLGLCQFIKRKSLWEVDPSILLLGVFYIVFIAVYLFFEFAVVNYRPVILHTNLEASYPSSHTMIVICIMATAMLQFHRLLRGKRRWLIVTDSVSVLLIVVTVIGRLVSGVHWFTDIIGGILLSSALVMLYHAAVTCVEAKSRHMPNDNTLSSLE